MNTELSAALVGGLVSGLVVIAGVVLAEVLNRSRLRRDRISRAGRELLDALPTYQFLLSEPWADEKLAPGEPLPVARDRVQAYAFELRWLVQRGRRFEPARAAVDEVIARSSAAFIRYTKGLPLEPHVTLGGRFITEALFSGGNDLGDRIMGLVDHGLPTVFEDAPQ